MKVRLLIVLVISLALLGTMALMTAPVNADGGPHRQRTSLANLTSCGECHRAHTGESSKLIAAPSVYDLCITCHGPSYHTAENVQDGWYNGGSPTVTAPLKGGGFLNVTMNNTYTATVLASLPTTSQHEVIGMTGYTGDTVWGFGASASGAGLANFQLECSTCHDPHGGSGIGTDPTTGYRLGTYRILRSDLGSKLGSSVVPLMVPDNQTKKYYIDDTTTDRYYGQKYPTGNEKTPAAGQENAMATTLSNWCATCHTRIHAASGGAPETTSSGDTIFNFRHRTDGNNVAFNFDPTKAPVDKPSGGAPSCVTCHVSHGSNSSLLSTRGTALQVPVPGGNDTTGPFLDSALLRLDGRGVCEACHNK